MTTGSNSPPVTVVCLCYNQARFVREAIQSVFDQTYPNVELIVVDDKSSDNSVAVIEEVLKEHPEVTFIKHTENRGNCKSFNEAWRIGKGEYFIDLAADDALPRNRIELGVREFSMRDASYGVQYGIESTMDEQGNDTGLRAFSHTPDGDIYEDLIKLYFVPSATLLVRRSVLEKLDGYDESLAYEDFDFLIRSSRFFKYFYTGAVLVRKRIVKGSMSDRQFQRGNPQQLSTLRVCRKIHMLNRTTGEDKALEQRVAYEGRQALMRLELGLWWKYFRFFDSLSKVSRPSYK